MKQNTLLFLFFLSIAACFVVSGLVSLELMFRSFILIILVAVLLVVGISYVVKQVDEEDGMQH